MPSSTLSTLGGFTFQINGVAGLAPATRKARALMTFLIMNQPSEASRERVLETFWPDVDPTRARDSLKTAIWSIRRCLRTAGVDPDAFLVSTKATLRWATETSVDAIQFVKLVERSEPAAIRQALELFRGDFLEGDYDNWAVTERERLAGLYETILGRAVTASHDTEAAHRFIARNPYAEEPYAVIVDAELAAGRRSSAAAWVERCREALAQVGERPSESFEARFANIVRIEPAVLDALSLPFTGRDSELRSLAAKISETSLGRGSLTLVQGEPGIGKSTLLSRVARIATETHLRVLQVRCTSEAFGPWPEVFASIEAGDFETFARSHGAGVAPAMATAVADRLVGPSVIIVDDLQNLSGDGLTIFAILARLLSSTHTIVAALRPEGLTQVRSGLADLAFEEIVLGRLDRQQVRWALDQALGDDQPDLSDVLYNRTGGHPLFFVGLLNSLVSVGALARDGHRWQLIKRVTADLQLPETVKRFIETRLHARGDAPRTVACALALEPSASADDLAYVLHAPDATVLDALDDLLALGLITQPSEGAQFAFAHDLVREVAAGSLNAGRRTALHRAFAQRLRESGGLEGAYRLARHCDAAGEHLRAAEAYFRSAKVALELNAMQDTIERCKAGIQSVEKADRSAERVHLTAELYRLWARAAIALGNAADAIDKARDAVMAASGDPNESGRAVLDLAMIEAAAFLVSEQKSDAEEAFRHAVSCNEEALEAQALIVQANAARQLGLRDEALHVAHAAGDLANRCGRPDLALAALEELLRAQTTWWLFDQALESAQSGLNAARRLGPLAESSFREARCALWYLLERFEDGCTELREAMGLANEAFGRVNFAGHYMMAKISAARREWDLVLDAVQRADAVTNIAKMPRYREALSLLRIDAMLQRNRGADSETAHELTQALGVGSFPQGTIGWSDCVKLARARDAARCRAPGASALLHGMLDILEENAHKSLLDTDYAFHRLAIAAGETGELSVARRASDRSRHFRVLRRAAAGAAWGGEVMTNLTP